jgi:uncharacterized membrane protein
MTRYELLLFLHVTSVIIWLGAGFLFAVLVFGAERAGDAQKEASHHQDAGWLATRLFIPASFSSLVFGLWLVADSPAWDFDQLWINVGLVGWLASFGLGFFYFKPEGARIGALVESQGPGSAEARYRIRRLNIVDRFQTTILFLVVADMVIKPTGDDGGVLVVGALILAAVGALGLAALRRGGTGRAESPPASAPPG